MADKSVEGQPPPGFKLRHTLRRHEGDIGRIAWSPDGRMFASPSTAAKPTWVGWNPVPGGGLRKCGRDFQSPGVRALRPIVGRPKCL